MVDNRKMILDQYYKNVCFEWYKRQIYIWVLIRCKYLKNADISDQNYWGALVEDQYSYDEFVQPKDDESYPQVLLQQHEAQHITEISKKISSSLQHILAKTKDVKPVGDFTIIENEPEKKNPKRKVSKSPSLTRDSEKSPVRIVDVEDADEEKKEEVKSPKIRPSVNPYLEMGLTSDKTNLFSTIAKEVGLYGRQKTDGQKQGKKEGGKSGGKGTAKKKSNADKKSIEAMDYDDFKFLTLDENFIFLANS